MILRASAVHRNRRFLRNHARKDRALTIVVSHRHSASHYAQLNRAQRYGRAFSAPESALIAVHALDVRAVTAQPVIGGSGERRQYSMVYTPCIILESLNHCFRPPSARCAHFSNSFVIPQVPPPGVAFPGLRQPSDPIAGRSVAKVWLLDAPPTGVTRHR
jgi:hypothetical protein